MMQKLPLVRKYTIIIISLFILLGPSAKPVFNYDSPFLRSWRMFHNTGNNAFVAEYRLKLSNGEYSKMDRLKVLNNTNKLNRPNIRNRIKNETEAIFIGRQLCNKLGQDTDIRMYSRKADMNEGWIWVSQGEKNICQQ